MNDDDRLTILVSARSQLSCLIMYDALPYDNINGEQSAVPKSSRTCLAGANQTQSHVFRRPCHGMRLVGEETEISKRDIICPVLDNHLLTSILPHRAQLIATSRSLIHLWGLESFSTDQAGSRLRDLLEEGKAVCDTISTAGGCGHELQEKACKGQHCLTPLCWMNRTKYMLYVCAHIQST
jgi:hypothetical protein